MVPAGGRDSVRNEGAVTFASTLESLKERGSALLVVGAVPDEMYVRASTQMLGDPRATPPRRRLLASPTGNREREVDRLERTGPLSYEWARLVNYATECRSAAAVRSPAAESGSHPSSNSSMELETTFVDGPVAELGSAISNAIEDFDRAAGGLEPAELRVAFDCLPVILSEYDEETAFRFSHVLATQVRSFRGMGHLWLPKERDAGVVRTLEPLFDAVIELRLEDSRLMQRWHIRDAPLVSDWLALEG